MRSIHILVGIKQYQYNTGLLPFQEEPIQGFSYLAAFKFLPALVATWL